MRSLSEGTLDDHAPDQGLVRTPGNSACEVVHLVFPAGCSGRKKMKRLSMRGICGEGGESCLPVPTQRCGVCCPPSPFPPLHAVAWDLAQQTTSLDMGLCHETPVAFSGGCKKVHVHYCVGGERALAHSSASPRDLGAQTTFSRGLWCGRAPQLLSSSWEGPGCLWGPMKELWVDGEGGSLLSGCWLW